MQAVTPPLPPRPDLLSWASFLLCIQAIGCSNVESAVCPECRISATHLVTLADPSAPASPTDDSTVLRDESGTYYVTNMQGSTLVSLYDSTGNFMDELGIPGRGPREFRSVRRVLPVGDSLFVMDRGNMRIAVMDDERTIVRTFEMHGTASEFVQGTPGEFILYANTAEFPEGYQRPPLIRVDASGRPVGDFGEPRRTWGGSVRIASDRTGGVWITRPEAYDVEHFNGSGQLINRIRRQPSWFPTTAGARMNNARRRRLTMLADIAVDSTGNVWILVTDWGMKQDVQEEDGSEEVKPLGVEDVRGTMRGIVEVLRPSGEVLATAVLNQHVLGGFVDRADGGVSVFGFRETREGDLAIEIRQLMLHTSKREHYHVVEERK